MNISYYQYRALTVALCTILLFQICKPIVTNKLLCSHASPSAQCKVSLWCQASLLWAQGVCQGDWLPGSVFTAPSSLSPGTKA